MMINDVEICEHDYQFTGLVFCTIPDNTCEAVCIKCGDKTFLPRPAPDYAKEWRERVAVEDTLPVPELIKHPLTVLPADNRSFLEKLFSPKNKIEIPPIPKSKSRAWEVDQDFKDRHNVIMMECGWCGHLTFCYLDPLRDHLAHPNSDWHGDTRCGYCDRGLGLFLQNWQYYCEYSDGCYYLLWPNGNSSSGGPKHAPHEAFCPNDEPVIAWGYR